jgi:hypothetical protein
MNAQIVIDCCLPIGVQPALNHDRPFTVPEQPIQEVFIFERFGHALVTKFADIVARRQKHLRRD